MGHKQSSLGRETPPQDANSEGVAMECLACRHQRFLEQLHRDSDNQTLDAATLMDLIGQVQQLTMHLQQTQQQLNEYLLRVEVEKAKNKTL